MTRQPTSRCDDLIKRFESFVPVVAPDPGGVPTGGWGHTRGVYNGMKVSPATGQAWFNDDRQEAIDTIYRYMPITMIESLPSECYDALVSFIFNVGDQAFVNGKTGKVHDTDFYRAISTDITAVPAQMRRWIKDNGRVLNGLVARRGREAELWESGLKSEPPRQTPAAPESSVKPQEPAPPPPAPSASVGAAAGVTSLTGAGTLLVDTAHNLGTSNPTSSVVMVLIALLTLFGVAILGWSAWRTHRPKQ